MVNILSAQKGFPLTYIFRKVISKDINYILNPKMGDHGRWRPSWKTWSIHSSGIVCHIIYYDTYFPANYDINLAF